MANKNVEDQNVFHGEGCAFSPCGTRLTAENAENSAECAEKNLGGGYLQVSSDGSREVKPRSFRGLDAALKGRSSTGLAASVFAITVDLISAVERGLCPRDGPFDFAQGKLRLSLHFRLASPLLDSRRRLSLHGRL